jgi:hypothetical protein
MDSKNAANNSGPSGPVMSQHENGQEDDTLPPERGAHANPSPKNSFSPVSRRLPTKNGDTNTQREQTNQSKQTNRNRADAKGSAPQNKS